MSGKRSSAGNEPESLKSSISRFGNCEQFDAPVPFKLIRKRWASGRADRYRLRFERPQRDVWFRDRLSRRRSVSGNAAIIGHDYTDRHHLE